MTKQKTAWKDHFNMDAAILALDDHRALISAFPWNAVPERGDYWHNRYEHGHTKFSRTKLQSMIAEMRDAP